MAGCAVIAGGAGAIGRAVAESWLKQGYTVHLVDHAPAVSSVAESLGAIGHRCDAADHDAVAAALAGVERVDVLLNAVGSWPTASLDDLTATEWERQLRVNLTVPFVTVKALLAPLRAARGAVVNLSSTTAVRGAPTMIAYSAAKAGLLGLTRSLAAALGPDGVRVNAVLPGILVAESTAGMSAAPFERARAERALRRDGVPEDIVGAVLFLASPAAGFITGQSLIVDGGQLFG